jgi:hypothetical protein
MATRPIQALSDDFAELLEYFKASGVLPNNPSLIQLEFAKRIHRTTFSLILWRFRLTGLPQHSRVFIEEIASDALQILPQILVGYTKTTKLLIRGIIENLLRHTYFHDHPVEFERMNRDTKWYVPIDKLFEYQNLHPLFMATERQFDAINRLSTLYSDLSAGVHGRTVKDLEMRTALNRIRYADLDARTVTELVGRCAEATNFLLAMFHRDQLLRFTADDRRIILRTIPPRARRSWREYE